MSVPLGRRTGSALLWKTVQLVAGRGLGMARTLLLTAILAPEAFGALAVALLVVDVSQNVTDLGLRHALIQRPEADERHLDAAWTANLLRAGVLTLAAIGAAPVVADLFHQPQSTNVIRLLAFAPLLIALQNIGTVELERELAYRPLTWVTISTALTDAAVALLLASSLGVYGLVTGILVGHAVGGVASYLVAPRRPRWRVDAAAIRPLLDYGRWVLATGLVVVVGGAVLQATISRRLGATELGLWYLGARIALLPNEVVGDIVAGVAFSLHSRIQDDHARVRRVFQSSLVALLGLLAPVYAVMIGVTPALVSTVLGPEWSGTTEVIYVLAIAGTVGVVADSAMPLLQGQGRPRDITVMFAVRSAVIVVLVWWLAASIGLVGAALAWLLAEVAAQVTIGWYATRHLSHAFDGVLRRVALVLTASAVAGGAAFFMQAALGGAALGLVAGAAVGMLISGGALLALDRWFALGIGHDVVAMVPALGRLIGRTRPAHGGMDQ